MDSTARSQSRGAGDERDASSNIATTSAVTLDHPMAEASASVQAAVGSGGSGDGGVKEEDEDAKLFTSLVNGIQSGALAAAATGGGSEGQMQAPGMLDSDALWSGLDQSVAFAPSMANGMAQGTEHIGGSMPFPASEPESLGPIQAYAKLEFPGFSYYIQTLDFTIGRRPAHFREQIANQLHITGASKAEGDVDVDLGPLKSISRFHVRVFYQDQPAQSSWAGQGSHANTQHHDSQSSRSSTAAEDERGPKSAGQRTSPPTMSMPSHVQGRFVLQVLGRNGACVDDVYVGKGAIVPLGRRTKIQVAERVFYFVLPPPMSQAEVAQHSDQHSYPVMAEAQRGGMEVAADEEDGEDADDGSGRESSESLGSSGEEEEEAESKGKAADNEDEEEDGESSESSSGSEESGSEDSEDEDEEEDAGEAKPQADLPKASLLSTPQQQPTSASIASAQRMPQPPPATAHFTPSPAPTMQSTTGGIKRKQPEATADPGMAHATVPTPVAPEPTSANKRRRNKKPPAPTGPYPGHMPMGGHPGMTQPMNPLAMFGALHGGIVGPATAALLQQFSNTPGAAQALMAATGGAMSSMNTAGQNPYMAMMSPMPYSMGPPGPYGMGPPGMPPGHLPGQMGSPMAGPGSPYYGGNALHRGSPARTDRPDKPNIELIREAMSSPLSLSRGGKMTLQEVYDYLSSKYEYFRTTSRTNGHDWHNSIRHTMQGNKTMVKIPRKPHESSGKGTFYAFAESEAAKQHTTDDKSGLTSSAIKTESTPPAGAGASGTNTGRPVSGVPMTPGAELMAKMHAASPQRTGQASTVSAASNAQQQKIPTSGTPTPRPQLSTPVRPPSGPGSGAQTATSQGVSTPTKASQTPQPPVHAPKSPDGRPTLVICSKPPSNALAGLADLPKSPMTQKVESLLGGPPIVHYTDASTIYLSITPFASLGSKRCDEISAQGTQQALKTLQNYLVTHLRTKMGMTGLENASPTFGIATTPSVPRVAGSSSSQPGLPPASMQNTMRPSSTLQRPPATSSVRPDPKTGVSGRPPLSQPSATRPPISRPPLQPPSAAAKASGPAGLPNGRPPLARPPLSRPSAQPPSATIARPGQMQRPVSVSSGAATGRPGPSPPLGQPAVKDLSSNSTPASGRPGAGATLARPGAPRPASAASSTLTGTSAAARPGGPSKPPTANGAARPGQPAPVSRPPGQPARPFAPKSQAAARPPSARPAVSSSSSTASDPSSAKAPSTPAPMSADIAELLSLLGGGKIDSGKLTPAQHELLQRAGRLAAEQQRAQQAKASGSGSATKSASPGAQTASAAPDVKQAGQSTLSSEGINAGNTGKSSQAATTKTAEASSQDDASASDQGQSKASPPTTRAQAAATQASSSSPKGKGNSSAPSSSPSKTAKTTSAPTPPTTRRSAASAQASKDAK